jgi:hypothetical protein
VAALQQAAEDLAGQYSDVEPPAGAKPGDRLAISTERKSFSSPHTAAGLTGRAAALMSLPLKRTIDHLPGGMMIVPLFTGAIITTSGRAWASISGRSRARCSPDCAADSRGVLRLPGVTIDLRTPDIVKKGGALFGAKVLTGVR